jgi:7,8-dihydropterin-6-yl-methyl-4-(beta-D-ribofuranosyl)aminobenzene 5'-phosphate synthase
MNETICLTTLVENSVHLRGLRAEHGLAFHIQAGDRSLLFDTGQSDLLLANAAALGVDLAQVEAIVLSHGHYDHTGGLAAVRRVAPQARIFLHPAAVEPKFSANADSPARPVGMLATATQAVSAADAAVTWTREPTEVLPGVFVTGEVPRTTAFEDTGGHFFLDAAGTGADPLVDDQALFFDTADGVVVILGCAHAGVVNTLRHIRRLLGNRRIHTVCGGLHLLTASPARMDATVAALRELDGARFVPAHCTGFAATARLWAEFPGRGAVGGVGTRLLFPAKPKRGRFSLSTQVLARPASDASRDSFQRPAAAQGLQRR